MKISHNEWLVRIFIAFFILCHFLLAQSGFCEKKQKKESSSIFHKDMNPQDLGNGIYLYKAKRLDGTTMSVYTNRNNIFEPTPKTPILIATGSGCKSLCRDKDGIMICSSLLKQFVQHGAKYSIFAMEKRGVEPMSDNIGNSPDSCSKEFQRFSTRSNRISELSTLLHSIDNLPSVNTKRVILAGYSEGSGVVAALATNTKVTHLGLFAGGGPSHMFDLILRARREVMDKSATEVEQKIETLMTRFRDVIANPTDSAQKFLGASYQRWHGYFKYSIIENIAPLNIPIFLAHGVNDKIVPVFAADYIEMEFIRLGKTNLTVHRYPYLDHNLWQIPKKYSQSKLHSNVVDDFFTWLEGN